MRQFQQESLPENIDVVSLKSFVINEKTGELIYRGDVPTASILIEDIEDYSNNAFWLNLNSLWILIGKVPPLTVNMDDIVIFKEKDKWGLFRFAGKTNDMVILTDGFRRKKTKVKDEYFFKLNLLGKVIRVQRKL